MTPEAVQELRDWEAAEQDPADIEALRREAYGNAGGDDLGKVGQGGGEGSAGERPGKGSKEAGGKGQGSKGAGAPGARKDGGLGNVGQGGAGEGCDRGAWDTPGACRALRKGGCQRPRLLG